MRNQEICSFYVSEFHLLTKILPYINEKINEGIELKIIAQKDLSKSVKEYLKNVKNHNFNTEKLLNLSWKKERRVENLVKGDNLIFIGDRKFLDKQKEKITLDENKKVLYCYKIRKTNELDNIINQYNMYLNTKGIQMVSKNSQNAQKTKTIKSQL